MLHPHAAMLRSPSSLRSLLHLSRRRLLPTNPRLSRSPLSTSPRFLSSSSSPTPGGEGGATYDPLTDSLSASAALPSATASDSEAPAVSDAWGVYDPALRRVVKQGSLSPSSSTTVEEQEEEEEEDEDEEGDEAGELEDEAGELEEGKKQASALRGNGQVKWSSVAAARRPARKGGKERSSYVCSHCGEGDSQWWGKCRHCGAMGTVDKYVPGPEGGGAADHIARSWIPQKAKEMVPQSLQEVNKGVDQAQWRIPL